MIELYAFQKEASDSIADRFFKYSADPVMSGTKQNPRIVPFFQALASVTASGKTVILADAVATIAALLPVSPVILWLSKGKVVVDQTYTNLTPGGKYHHLLGSANVKTLAEYDELEVLEANQPSLFLATVGTFNQKDKELGSRLIFQSEVDTQDQSTWDLLRTRSTVGGTKRPLIIVYDEAHNLSDQQTKLLMELAPNAFLLASATMRLPQEMGEEVALLRNAGWTDDQLITNVDAKQVAESGLIKSTLLLAGYNAPMEETISVLIADMKSAEEDARFSGLAGQPKAIYVCRTNIVEGNAYQKDDANQPFDQRQAPPILIWRHLVHEGVNPDDIAVYCTLSFKPDFPAPSAFHLFKGGDADFTAFTQGNYRHIIFNLSLQEGWDDPYCYFAYIDKSMDSHIQVEQVIGRLLRQPEGRRSSAERLNTAHFYVRVDRNNVFNELLETVSRKLSSDAPSIRLVQAPPGKPTVREYAPKSTRTVASVAVITDEAARAVGKLLGQFTDYSNDNGANTKGIGSRRLSKQTVGETEGTTTEWEEYEQSSLVSVRWVFQREVRRRLPNVLGVAPTSGPAFDTLIGIGSNAFAHTLGLASQVIDAFVDNVYLRQKRVDPYEVGSILAREDEVIAFKNALHDGYSGLNTFELAFARALDGKGLSWCRNPAQIGYGIPLITVGRTHTFYPDFLIWLDDRVIAVDTTGGHLLPEKAVRKLLRIEAPTADTPRLNIHFVSDGKWNSDIEQEDTDGYTIWGLKPDNSRKVTHVGDLDDAVKYLLES